MRRAAGLAIVLSGLAAVPAAGQSLTGELRAAAFADHPLRINLTREWPASGFVLELGGGRREAGERPRLSVHGGREQAAIDRLEDMGVREGASRFGDKARWYIFAAASGRAVGLNMLHNQGGWDKAGWTTDPTSELVGDGQIAIAWRKGPYQSAIGILTREVSSRHRIFAQHTYEDYVAAWSFSIRPQF